MSVAPNALYLILGITEREKEKERERAPDMETLSALLAICEGNAQVDWHKNGSVMQSFHAIVVVHINKLMNKLSNRMWLETT